MSVAVLQRPRPQSVARPAAPAPLISMRNVCKGYGSGVTRNEVLTNINLNVLAIAMFGIVGLAGVSGAFAPAPYEVVATGCVGGCGSTSVIPYRVADTRTQLTKLSVARVSSSLCPNTGAEARIYRGKMLIAYADLTPPDAEIEFQAMAGESITVVVSTFDTGEEIVCIQQGELIYELRRWSASPLYPSPTASR